MKSDRIWWNLRLKRTLILPQNFAERLAHRVLAEIFLKFKFQIGNIWFRTLPSNRLPKKENKKNIKNSVKKNPGAYNFKMHFWPITEFVTLMWRFKI